MILLVLIAFPTAAFAQEGNDVMLGNFELDKLLNLGSAILATALCFLTFTAYKRKGGKRLLYVTFAFLIFAVKGYLMSLELLFGDLGWIDPITSILDFAMLFSFFLGIIKK